MAHETKKRLKEIMQMKTVIFLMSSYFLFAFSFIETLSEELYLIYTFKFIVSFFLFSNINKINYEQQFCSTIKKYFSIQLVYLYFLMHLQHSHPQPQPQVTKYRKIFFIFFLVYDCLFVCVSAHSKKTLPTAERLTLYLLLVNAFYKRLDIVD